MQVLFTPRFELDRIARPRDAASEAATARYRAARGRYMELTGISDVRADADVEDWHENVAMLLAARNAGLPVHVIDRSQHDGRPVEPVLSLGGTFDPMAPTLHLGAHPKRSALLDNDPTGRETPNVFLAWPTLRDEREANGYARTDTFRARAGRRVAIADIAGEGPRGDRVESGAETEAAGILHAWAQTGPVDALVKIVVHAKYGPLEAIRLPAGASLADARAALTDALGYALIHLEGMRSALLLQDRVEMRDEYRVFVVDGEPVTGAGCIEHHTPWDRVPGHAFDPQVEAVRGSGEIRQDATLAQHYRDFAHRIAQEFARERPAMTDYVLDIAHLGDRAPVVVELNPLPASGLYASDVDRLVKRIAERTAADWHHAVNA